VNLNDDIEHILMQNSNCFKLDPPISRQGRDNSKWTPLGVQRSRSQLLQQESKTNPPLKR